MHLKAKIFLGFFVMALAFSGGVLVCLKTLGPIERSFERHTIENVPVLSAVQDIRTYGSILHAEMLELSYLMALEQTPAMRHALTLELAEINQTGIHLRNKMQEYRKLVELYFPEESSYITMLQTQIDQLLAATDELRGQDQGSPVPFSLTAKNHFEALEQSFLAVTNEIVSYEQREVQMRREMVNQTVDQAKLWIVASAGISLLLALVLTLIMSRASSGYEPTGGSGRRVRHAPRRQMPRD